MLGLSIPLGLMIPTFSEWVSANPTATPLMYSSFSISLQVLNLLRLFWAANLLIMTCYGGTFSILPAYVADLFGQKNAGAIFGKLLTGKNFPKKKTTSRVYFLFSLERSSFNWSYFIDETQKCSLYVCCNRTCIEM